MIGYDKQEIVNIAEKIGTYETSIQPYEDCCTVFLPKNPVIKPKLSVAEAEYNKIIDLPQLIDEAINNVEVVKIKNKR